MTHIETAKSEIKEFAKSPALEHIEVAKVHALIAIGEGLFSLLEYLENESTKPPSNGKPKP